MIPERWYVILESREVAPGKVVGVTRGGRSLAVWRTVRGDLGCLDDVCIHRGASLGLGAVVGEHVQCPFHGFEYDAGGRCRCIPASGRAAHVPDRFVTESLPVREDHGFVWLWWGAVPDELPPLPMFDNLAEGWLWSGFVDDWPLHYTRAIENQLDVAHLAFVHDTTIGRGKQTLVDGPGMEAGGDDIRFWVRNRRDDGSAPVPSAELDESVTAVSLQFRFPHLWQNILGDKAAVFLAFVPVDENNTRIYMRFYQRMITVPLLGHLVAWMGKVFSIVILRQDKRVVVTQRPIRTALRMGELLIPADRPIAAFRQRRHELLESGDEEGDR
jgi:phenylpropionate dioxygenase-like ring-hydroxylating dioxygenase large terminal subunit